MKFKAAEKKDPIPDVFDGTDPSNMKLSELIRRLMRIGEAISRKKLYKYQEQVTYRIYEAILLRQPDTITCLFSRQCIGKDQIVLNRDGSATRMSDSPGAWMTGEKKPVFRLTLRGGYEIDSVTKEHVFFTPEGEKELRDLSVGDDIRVVTRQDKWRGDSELRKTLKERWRDYEFVLPWSHEAARVLGYMTADGYADTAIQSGQAPKFTNINREILIDFCKSVKKCFPKLKLRWRQKGKGFDIHPTHGQKGSPSLFTRFIRSVDWDEGFPRDIFNLTEEHGWEFLRAVMSSDGYFTDREAGISCGNSRVYARYMQTLVQKLGVRSRLKEEWLKKSTKPFYRLIVTGGRETLTLCEGLKSVTAKNPQMTSLWSKYASRPKSGDLGGGKGNVVREMFPVDEWGPDGEELSWGRITKIEPAGEDEVWDREVPGKGWFTCQGIKAHNSGKSTTISQIAAVSAIMFPFLASALEGDPYFDKLLNLHDEQGNYRGFKYEYSIGIYAPKEQQAELTFEKVKDIFSTEECKALLAEMGITSNVWNGNSVILSNGSKILCSSASLRAKIEGETHHLVIAEESQDIEDIVLQKSMRPFLASTSGLMVMIGTANARVSEFYKQIRFNQAISVNGGRQNHFEFPYHVCEKYNSLYRTFVAEEKRRLGTDSDAFRMAFACKFIIERGMLISEKLINHPMIAHQAGPWSKIYDRTPSSMPIIVGIDFARKEDSTVVTVGTADFAKPVYRDSFYTTEGFVNVQAVKKHVLGWLEIQGDEWEDQFHTIWDYLSHFRGLEKIVLDGTGLGDVLFNRFSRHYQDQTVEVVPFVFSRKSKSDMYKLLLSELQQKRVSYPSGSEAISSREMQKFKLQLVSAEKNYKGSFLEVEGPPDIHDDYVDSLAMFVFGCQEESSNSEPLHVSDENPFL